jgi:Immunity protein 50
MAKRDDDLGVLIGGASQLIDLYGYFPTFHDAVVESIFIEKEGPTVTIRFTANGRDLSRRRDGKPGPVSDCPDAVERCP